jgi:hypothetical protein
LNGCSIFRLKRVRLNNHREPLRRRVREMLKKSMSMFVIAMILMIPLASYAADDAIVKKVGEDEYDLLLTDQQVKDLYENKSKAIKLTPEQSAAFKKILGKDLKEISTWAIFSSVYENRITLRIKK